MQALTRISKYSIPVCLRAHHSLPHLSSPLQVVAAQQNELGSRSLTSTSSENHEIEAGEVDCVVIGAGMSLTSVL